MTAPIIIDTDQGRILAHAHPDGSIILDVFTDYAHTRKLTAREGREHIDPTQILAGHTADATIWWEFGRWLINAATATMAGAEHAKVDAENENDPPPDVPF